jgi:hypothetical protein
MAYYDGEFMAEDAPRKPAGFLSYLSNLSTNAKIGLCLLLVGMLQWIWGAIFSDFVMLAAFVKYDLGAVYSLAPILSTTAYFLGFLHLLRIKNKASRVLLSLLLSGAFLGLSYVVTIIVVVLGSFFYVIIV